MLHSEFLRHLNLGVMIRQGVATDDPAAKIDLKKHRNDLLNSCVYITEVCDFFIGVKPVTFVDENKLNVLWTVSVLHRGQDGGFLAIDINNFTELEKNSCDAVKFDIREMEKHDLDIEETLTRRGGERFSFS